MTKKEKLINGLKEIYYWNDKLADFYNEPNKISELRNVIFDKINKLKTLIDKI